MYQPGSGTGFITTHTKGILRKKHVMVELTENDWLCQGCDLVVDGEKNKIWPGSEYDPPA